MVERSVVQQRAPTLSPSPRIGIVQRKCACGGTPGPTGECAECRRKRLQDPAHGATGKRLAASDHALAPAHTANSTMHAHPIGQVGHHFDRMRLRPAAARLSEQGLREEAGETARPSMVNGEVVLRTTGGYSMCNLAGDAPLIVNENDECSRPCTQEHEEFHVRDWGVCCEDTRAAYKAGDTARKADVLQRWNEWLTTNEPYHECRAYGVSIRCADQMATTRDCSGASPADPDCCTQLASYRANVVHWQTHYCGQPGSGARTRCPFPELGDFPLPPRDIAVA